MAPRLAFDGQGRRTPQGWKLTHPRTGERMVFAAKVPDTSARTKKAGRTGEKDIEDTLKEAFGES